MSSILSTTSAPTTTSSSTATSSNTGSASLASLGQGVVSSLASGTVTSTGLGSGLDINSIVQSLISAEGKPQQQLITQQQNKIQAQLSAYGTLQASISAVEASLGALSTPQQFEGNAATVGDSKIASATTDSTATTGSYTFSVTQLATGSQLQSGNVTSASSTIGTGTLAFSVGSSTFNVTIDSSNDTLSGLAAAINSAGSGAGVSASIITTNGGASLVINSATTGLSNQLAVSETDGGTGLAGFVYDPSSSESSGSSSGLTLVHGAQDAIVTLNGSAYNSASNVVTGLLTGVTLNLAAASQSGVTTTLTIAPDSTGTASSIQSFVTAYNSLQQTIASLSSYDATTGQAGELLGDPLLGNLVNQVNETLDATVKMPSGSPFTSLAQLGIVANTDGTLSANSTKLNNALSTNLSAVAQLFSGTGGVATQLSSILNGFTEAAGVIPSEQNSLKAGLTALGTQQTALNQKLSTEQATLLAQYNAMDALVAQLKATGTSVDAQLSSIYYPGESNTPVP